MSEERTKCCYCGRRLKVPYGGHYTMVYRCPDECEEDPVGRTVNFENMCMRAYEVPND